MLVNGKWMSDWHPVQFKDEAGRFVRQQSSFRNWVTRDGAAGPTGGRARLQGLMSLTNCGPLTNFSPAAVSLGYHNFHSRSATSVIVKAQGDQRSRWDKRVNLVGLAIFLRGQLTAW
jgi:hypothetical protein